MEIDCFFATIVGNYKANSHFNIRFTIVIIIIAYATQRKKLRLYDYLMPILSN